MAAKKTVQPSGHRHGNLNGKTEDKVRTHKSGTKTQRTISPMRTISRTGLQVDCRNGDQGEKTLEGEDEKGTAWHLQWVGETGQGPDTLQWTNTSATSRMGRSGLVKRTKTPGREISWGV